MGNSISSKCPFVILTISMGLKRCPKCGETKPHELFYRNKNYTDNCSSYCKVCSNIRSTEYARKNRHKIPTTKYSLKRRYGITEEQYAEMLESQGYKCAICGADQCSSGRNFAVDHNHETGKVRGLLCSNCNTSLGRFKDNRQILLNALAYLEKHNEFDLSHGSNGT